MRHFKGCWKVRFSCSSPSEVLFCWCASGGHVPWPLPEGCPNQALDQIQSCGSLPSPESWAARTGQQIKLKLTAKMRSLLSYPVSICSPASMQSPRLQSRARHILGTGFGWAKTHIHVNVIWQAGQVFCIICSHWNPCVIIKNSEGKPMHGGRAATITSSLILCTHASQNTMVFLTSLEPPRGSWRLQPLVKPRCMLLL